jgi:hypothetical protein
MIPEFDILPFELFGLHLQEPMALVTNWCMCIFAFYAYKNIPAESGDFLKYWRFFFGFMTIGTFFGGLGHLFYQYTGIYGKMPCWIFGTIAGLAASLGMFSLIKNTKWRNLLIRIAILESFTMLVAAMVFKSFIFIAVDAVFTYLFACGFVGYFLFKKSVPGAMNIVVGVMVLFPSVFLFVFKINFHKFLNRDDLSHLLMLGCIILFFLGTKKFNSETQKSLA